MCHSPAVQNLIRPIDSRSQPAPPDAALRIDQRSLHLIDVENLMGSPAFESECVAELRARYNAVAIVGPRDLVVVASSHFAAVATWFGWPGARRLARSGVNGADMALIDVIENEGLADRFTRVVVASGDGIFANPCSELQRLGCTITVVARADAVSRRLALAVRDIRYLGPHVHGAPSFALREVG